MNYKEIIKEINYNGEYTKEVKKKIRELLKKYHPDHYKKESDTFKLINEIKKNLDNGKKIGFDKPTEKIKEEYVDDFKISEEILDLSKKMDKLIDEKNACKKKLLSLQEKYRIEYNSDFDYRNRAFDSTNIILKYQSKQQKYNILLVISIILSIIFIFTKWYWAIIISVILFVYAFYKYTKTEIVLNNEFKNNKKIIEISENNIKKIHAINEEINSLYKQIWDIDCDINRINTRVNLLKAKIR